LQLFQRTTSACVGHGQTDRQTDRQTDGFLWQTRVHRRQFPSGPSTRPLLRHGRVQTFVDPTKLWKLKFPTDDNLVIKLTND